MDPAIENLGSTTFAGKRLTRKQIHGIRETTRAFTALSRRELAHTICEHLKWRTPAGKHQIQSCLGMLESLEALGIVSLPKKETRKKGSQKPVMHTTSSEPQPLIDAPLDQLTPISVQLAVDKHEVALWNELVDRHHYLGYRKPIGQHIRYFVVDRQGRKLGCLLFSYDSKSLSCCDQWIGWQDQTYKNHLNLLVNNNRFMLLPWVNVKCITSKALSIACKQVADDWQALCKIRPVLIETFVDPSKFKATCYCAANWQHLGNSRGLATTKSLPGKTAKQVYVFPLVKNAKSMLINGPDVNTNKSKVKPGRADKPPKQLDSDDPFVQLWKNIIGIVIQVAHDLVSNGKSADEY